MTLIDEELTYKIIGAIYKVYNALGYGYKEKEYQKAFAIELELLKLFFKRELYSVLKFEGKVITKFFVDFLVENKVVVELKVANDFYPKHRQQVIQYLQNHNLKTGITAVITPQKVLIKRVINSNSRNP